MGYVKKTIQEITYRFIVSNKFDYIALYIDTNGLTAIPKFKCINIINNI